MIRRTPEEHRDLVRLLGLKRHEQPPPGYFETFSAQVLAQIKATERRASRPWWQGVRLAFQAKPVLASAYCLLAVSLPLLVWSMLQLSAEPYKEEAPLPPGVWPQLSTRAAADLSDPVIPNRFSGTLNPLFSDGIVGDGNGVPPHFLLDGTGLKLQPVNASY
jgi:hypothetical protein